MALWIGWPAEGALAGIAAVMAFNAVVPHLALTLWRRRLQPGTATAWLLVVPTAALSLSATGPITGARLVQAVIVAALFVASVPVLLTLGRRREGRHKP